MTLASDIANDAAIFDGTETVTLRQLGRDGAAEFEVTGVTSSPLSRRQALALGGLVDLDGDEQVFSLPAVSITSGGVRRDDQITQADETLWIVKQCEQRTLNSRWSCICRRART